MANSSNQLLELIPPHRGPAGEVSLILNVSDRVGLGQVNKRHDVWTVQILMWYASSHKGADMKFGLPQLNGLFDAVTGLWIFHIQNLLKNRYGVRHQVVDGIVSPAHGSAFAHGAAWTIVILNALARKTDPGSHQSLVDGTERCPF